ncbi:MAG TPA: 16S rRNA (adenine(1518)-N(6)/adenine(1519)-N(6))-dimethyltransferase RsmA [Candidatus Dormibacteraeota bacterium]|nr:16S rRNA (adenine(1518)-N(6)/adenine(1519)-N(6))-dimethyltransferase RsmA [Candidatus Dormibacteraeota bacterium]
MTTPVEDHPPRESGFPGTPDAVHILSRHGIRAVKSLGQNFLRDGDVVAGIVAAIPAAPERVLEIGPGPGTLTLPLARRGQSVRAVELDHRLVEVLRLEAAGLPVEVVEGDALAVDLDRLVEPPFGVCGNIPYYITGALLPRLLTLRHRPEWVCVMVQEEVAERLCAPPGGWSLATLGVRAYAGAEVVVRVPAVAFEPAPKVDSAVIMLRPQPVPEFVTPGFFDFARAVFQERRKQLPNGVANALGHDVGRGREVVARSGLDAMRRPQTLDLDEWGRLYAAFGAAGVGTA